MPPSWPFSAGLNVQGSEACIEYNFRTPGNIRQRQAAGHSLLLYPRQGEATELEVGLDSDAYAAQLNAFAQAVREGAPPAECPPRDAVAVLHLIEGCRRSLTTGGTPPAAEFSIIFPETHV